MLEVPAGNIEDIDFQVPLTEAGPVEAVETFVLLLVVVSGDGVVGERSCATALIGNTPSPTNMSKKDPNLVN